MCQCTQQTRRAEILGTFQPVTTKGSNPLPTDQGTATTAQPINLDLVRAAIAYRSPKERMLSTLQILATVLAIVVSIRLLLIQKQ